MSGLGLTFLRRGNLAHPTAGSDYIFSETRGDAEVFRILLSKGVSSDGIGITKDDAAKVTSISTWFRDNDVIESFDEFEYFTGVVTIPANAFYSCGSLKSIVFPESVTSMADYMNDNEGNFAKCESLERVKLSANLTKISRGAFKSCSQLNEIDLRCEKVTTISQYAFSSSALLNKIIFFPNLTSVGANAFYNSGIASVESLGNITILSNKVFEKCVNLKKVTLPNTLQTISASAFSGCTSLTDAAIPQSVTSIDISAFNLCSAFKSVIYLPNLSGTIGDQTFRGTAIERVESLGNITGITFSKSSIGWDQMYPCFYGCKMLKFVRLPETLTKIGLGTFSGCTSLETIICEATTPPTLAASVFASTNSTFIIYVPNSAVDAYKTAANWSSYATRIKPISEYTE